MLFLDRVQNSSKAAHEAIIKIRERGGRGANAQRGCLANGMLGIPIDYFSTTEIMNVLIRDGERCEHQIATK